MEFLDDKRFSQRTVDQSPGISPLEVLEKVEILRSKIPRLDFFHLGFDFSGINIGVEFDVDSFLSGNFLDKKFAFFEIIVDMMRAKSESSSGQVGCYIPAAGRIIGNNSVNRCDQ